MIKGMYEIVQSPINFDDDWRIKSACRGEDPQQFFPDGGTGMNQILRKRHLEEVRDKYCDYCPVLSKCAKYAIVSAQEHGIWGGMSEKELKDNVKQYKTDQTLPPFIID